MNLHKNLSYMLIPLSKQPKGENNPNAYWLIKEQKQTVVHPYNEIVLDHSKELNMDT